MHALTADAVDNIVRCVDCTTGDTLWSLSLHSHPCVLALSPRDAHAALTLTSNELVIIDINTRSIIHTMAICGEAGAVAYSHDGTYMALARDDKPLLFTTSALPKLEGGYTEGASDVFPSLIMSMRFTPSASSLITAGTKAYMTMVAWSVPGMTRMRQYTGHTGAILSVLFLSENIFGMSIEHISLSSYVMKRLLSCLCLCDMYSSWLGVIVLAIPTRVLFVASDV